MRLNIVERTLMRAFQQLGLHIGTRPWHWICASGGLFLLLSLGLLRFNFRVKTYDLITPFDSQSFRERDRIEELFPPNVSDNFDFGRATRMESFARVIVTQNDGGGEQGVLTADFFGYLRNLDGLVRNISILHEGRELRYADLCAKKDGECFSNGILDLEPHVGDFEKGLFAIKYPLMYDERNLQILFVPMFLGGVELHEGGEEFVKSARAVSMLYVLDFHDDSLLERNDKWEEAFLATMKNLPVNFSNLSVSFFTSESIVKEGERSILKTLPPFVLISIVLVIFSMCSNLTADCVTSKPWFPVFGLVVAGLGNGAAFGVCQLIGIPCFAFNIAVVILMTGIAMDDMFVLLAAWRRTDPNLDVPTRLSCTYQHAALAITMTSLTNALAFLIGSSAPFLMTFMFCSYSLASVVFCYLATITFFGGIIAIFGRIEAAGLSGYDCWTRAVPPSLAKGKPFYYRILYVGGVEPGCEKRPINKHCVMDFFGDTFGDALLSKVGISLIFTIYLVYLAVSICGAFRFHLSIDEKELSDDDSYVVKFWSDNYQYFQEYPLRVQVVIDGVIPYHEPEFQEYIEQIFRENEASGDLGDSRMTESWLRQYLNFMSTLKYYLSYRGLDITKEEDFIFGLRKIFLPLPGFSRFRQDIKFNDNYTKIVASRFLVQLRRMENPLQGIAMVKKYRRFLKTFPFKVYSYNPLYPFSDHIILLEFLTVQSVVIAILVMMAVSYIFIPQLLFVFVMTFTIVSVEVGIVGFMGHWNVPLNTITMVIMIVSVGFSVDTASHIVCAYKESTESTSEKRIRVALYYIGFPILQGYITTMIGSFALFLSGSAMKIDLFKIMALVMSFSAFHGLCILPLMIYFLEKVTRRFSQEKEIDTVIEENKSCNGQLLSDPS